MKLLLIVSLALSVFTTKAPPRDLSLLITPYAAILSDYCEGKSLLVHNVGIAFEGVQETESLFADAYTSIRGTVSSEL